jgi:hypothetical protein
MHDNGLQRGSGPRGSQRVEDTLLGLPPSRHNPQPDVGKIQTLPPGGNRGLIGNGTVIGLQDALYDGKDDLLIAVKPY